jgi:hypothetical protein
VLAERASMFNLGEDRLKASCPYALPRIDAKTGRIKLQAMGVEIDKLIKYLNLWEQEAQRSIHPATRKSGPRSCAKSPLQPDIRRGHTEQAGSATHQSPPWSVPRGMRLDGRRGLTPPSR